MTGFIKNLFNIGQCVKIKLRPLPPMFVVAVTVGENYDHVYALADNLNDPVLIITDIPQSHLECAQPAVKEQVTNTVEFERGQANAYGNMIDYVAKESDGSQVMLRVLSCAQMEFRRALSRIAILESQAG